MEAAGEALTQLPLAVVVVAADAGGERSCSTATASYVSFEPPLVVAPLAASSRTGALVCEAGTFSLSVLGDDQAEIAVRAAAPGEGDKFAEQGIAVIEPPPGHTAPGVAGSVAVLWCELESAATAGRTLLAVGRIRAAESARDGRAPLLRFERRYRALGAAVEVEAEADYPL